MSRAGRLARQPTPWAVLAGAGLLVALCLPSVAPGWLFWSAMALSCLGAAMFVLVLPEDRGA